MTSRVRTGAAAAALLLVSACGGGSSPSAPAQASDQQQTVNDGGTVDARSGSTVQVSATNFRFSPSTILATPGEKVTLVVRNDSGTPHTITATGVDQDLDPGSTHTVTLTVPASGELTFVCSFHQASGMVGRIGPSAAPAPATTAPPTSGGGGGYGGGYG
jgi:plastocyanin